MLMIYAECEPITVNRKRGYLVNERKMRECVAHRVIRKMRG